MDGTRAEHAIDREKLVTRHDILSDENSKVIPMGNGEFCFSCDVTGLQTLLGNTMAHWAWHAFPLPEGVTQADLPKTGCYLTGRLTGEGRDSVPADKKAAGTFMFQNPHTFSLGRLRLLKRAKDGQESVEVAAQDIAHVQRRCALWSGCLVSRFMLEGEPVEVTTLVHPERDVVAVRIVSERLCSDTLRVGLDFSYPAVEDAHWRQAFDREAAHETTVTLGEKSCQIVRRLDDTHYAVAAQWTEGEMRVTGAHSMELSAPGAWEVQLVCGFAGCGDALDALPTFAQTKEACARHWAAFWSQGGAIDLSESTDARWFELERRIVLSQYLLAVQSAGSLPCAEAGLMFTDCWSGQFHMEMTWWHIAHYFLWGRQKLAERQLTCYQTFLPLAKELAAQLGYAGAKWGKMVGPEGRTAPWVGNLALLWKQPHPIFFAELEYRTEPTTATLQKWAEIIDETAEHMADYATRGADGYFHLDPVMPPSELGFTHDTVFDLAYWQWGLLTAQELRQKMGKPRVPHWDEVACNLAPLPMQDGVYLRAPEWTDTYTEKTYEHPDPIGVYGMLPPLPLTDRTVARRTLQKIWQVWQKDRIWGWDFPWIAMAASRLGEPEMAVEAMLSGEMDVIGANGMGSYPYLPANGGILYAAAMMAVGREHEENPGFPKEGWVVRSEGLLNW